MSFKRLHITLITPVNVRHCILAEVHVENFALKCIETVQAKFIFIPNVSVVSTINPNTQVDIFKLTTHDKVAAA